MKKCECQVCGERFAKITHTHLQKHNMTREDYCKQFPGFAWQTKEHFVITPTDQELYINPWRRGTCKDGRGSNKRH